MWTDKVTNISTFKSLRQTSSLKLSNLSVTKSIQGIKLSKGIQHNLPGKSVLKTSLKIVHTHMSTYLREPNTCTSLLILGCITGGFDLMGNFLQKNLQADFPVMRKGVKVTRLQAITVSLCQTNVIINLKSADIISHALQVK